MRFLKIFIFILAIFIAGNNVMAKEILTKKEQNIVLISSYTASGDLENLEQATKKGLEDGLTVNEVKEVMVQLYAYCGFPRSINALTTLMQLETERGNSDILGKLPSAKPEGTALEYGAQNQTKLVGTEVKGQLFEFVPAIDEYLKAHLFGDIFARDNVDWQTRELATIAMLAAREGVDAQLQAHINIGKHNGLTDAQVSEILEISSATQAKDVVFGFGKENPYGQYFIGKSYLQPITTENGVPMFNVTFEPRCRNNWHIHHKGGQILLVTQGRGWYQEWGKPARALKAGDVVNIPPETKHWHGAAKDSWFTHIAVEVPSKDGSSEWLEPVTDEVYDKLEWK